MTRPKAPEINLVDRSVDVASRPAHGHQLREYSALLVLRSPSVENLRAEMLSVKPRRAGTSAALAALAFIPATYWLMRGLTLKGGGVAPRWWKLYLCAL